MTIYFAFGLVTSVSIILLFVGIILFQMIQGLQKRLEEIGAQFESFRTQASKSILVLDEALRKVETTMFTDTLLGSLYGKLAAATPPPNQQKNNRFNFKLVDLDEKKLDKKEDKKDD